MESSRQMLLCSHGNKNHIITPAHNNKWTSQIFTSLQWFYTWHGTAIGIKQIRDAQGALQNCISLPCGHGVELLESLLSTPAQEGMFDHQSHPFLTCHTHELQSGAELDLEQLMETQTPHPKQVSNCPPESLFSSSQYLQGPQQSQPAQNKVELH